MHFAAWLQLTKQPTTIASASHRFSTFTIVAWKVHDLQSSNKVFTSNVFITFGNPARISGSCLCSSAWSSMLSMSWRELVFGSQECCFNHWHSFWKKKSTSHWREGWPGRASAAPQGRGHRYTGYHRLEERRTEERTTGSWSLMHQTLCGFQREDAWTMSRLICLHRCWTSGIAGPWQRQEMVKERIAVLERELEATPP